MNNALNSFFGREDNLKRSICALILYLAANLCFKVLSKMYSLIVSDIVLVCCVICLYIAFNHHSKNVQKGMLGAILMWYLNDQISYVMNSLIPNGGSIFIIVFELFTLFLFAALFVNYFIIISDHHSKPRNVMINQIIAIAIAVSSIVQIVYNILFSESGVYILGEMITWNIALIGLMFMIVSYQTRFEIFKIRREEEAEE